MEHSFYQTVLILSGMAAMIAMATAQADGDPDEELVGRCQKGDKDAFGQLVLRYQNKVIGLCFRMFNNQDEAEEIAQEIFLKIYKSIQSFRGDSLFSTWVYRITHNICINQINYLKRRHYYDSTPIDADPDRDDVPKRQFESSEPSAEENLTAMEFGAAIEEALATLAPEMREIIIMRDIEDLSYEEIAAALDIKIGTVKSRLHRGRIELQALLKDYL